MTGKGERGGEKFWYELGMRLLKKPKLQFNRATPTSLRVYQEHFGCSPLVHDKCWRMLSPNLVELYPDVDPVHLLWACLFLRVYSKEAIHASLVGCTQKTFRKWVWNVIYALSDIECEVVSLIVASC